MVTGIAVSGLALVVGWLLLYGAVVWYRQRSLIADTPLSTVRSIPMGRVELEGTVEPAKRQFETPFGRTPAVLARYRILGRYRDTGGTTASWRGKESGVEMAPFYLNDGTGRVLVDATNASITPKTRTFELEAGEDDPDQIREFLEGREERYEEYSDSPTAVAMFGPKGESFRAKDASELIEERAHRRYVEEFLPVGETVHVFGTAQTREGTTDEADAGDIVVADGDDLPAFTVSYGSEDTATRASTKSILGFLSFGLVFALFGFLGLVTTSGPIVGVVLAAVTLGIAYALSGVVSRMGFATSA